MDGFFEIFSNSLYLYAFILQRCTFNYSHGLRTGIFEASKLLLTNVAPTVPEIQVVDISVPCSVGSTHYLAVRAICFTFIWIMCF